MPPFSKLDSLSVSHRRECARLICPKLGEKRFPHRPTSQRRDAQPIAPGRSGWTAGRRFQCRSENTSCRRPPQTRRPATDATILASATSSHSTSNLSAGRAECSRRATASARSALAACWSPCSAARSCRGARVAEEPRPPVHAGDGGADRRHFRLASLRTTRPGEFSAMRRICSIVAAQSDAGVSRAEKSRQSARLAGP